MKTRFLRLAVFCLFASLSFVPISLFSQETMPPAQALPAPELEARRGLGLGTGLKGIVAVDYVMRWKTHFNLRFGANFNHFSLKRSNKKILTSKRRYDIEARFATSNIEGLVEWVPGNLAKFRVVGGLGIFIGNELGGSGSNSETTAFNDVPVDPDEVGQAQFEVGWKVPICPYLGLAFGRAIPKNRIGFNFEMGGWLKGKPDFTIDSDGLLTENDRNEPILERNFKNQRFYPNLQFRFTYRL